MLRELRGKVAVVTGAAGGIGGALARALVREGCRVVVVDLAEGALRELAQELGDGATPHEMDVSDARAWGDLAGRVEREHGGLDLLVNNAGTTVLGTFAEHSGEDIDRMLGVNVGSVMHGCRVFVPMLAARRGAHIVNVSSLAGRVAFPMQSTYSATKFAVRGFSAALRMELAASRIGVTAVMPGAVATNLLGRARSYDASLSGKMAELMLAHGLRPDRLAKRVVRAIRRNEAEVLAGWDAHVTTLAHALAPSLVSWALTRGFGLRQDRRLGP